MDKKSVVLLLHRIGAPLTVPTLCWLMCDMFHVVDNRVRVLLHEMNEEGMLTLERGGWMAINYDSPLVKEIFQ